MDHYNKDSLETNNYNKSGLLSKNTVHYKNLILPKCIRINNN